MCAQALLRWVYRSCTRGNRVLPKEALDDEEPDSTAELAASPVKLGAQALKPGLPVKQAVPKLDLESTSSRDLLIGSYLSSSGSPRQPGDGSASPDASARSGFQHNQRTERQIASRANSWASAPSPPRSAHSAELNGTHS